MSCQILVTLTKVSFGLYFVREYLKYLQHTCDEVCKTLRRKLEIIRLNNELKIQQKKNAEAIETISGLREEYER